MDRFGIEYRQLVKTLFSVIIITLTTGCTSTYKIEYLVTSADSGGVSSEDFKAISESFLKAPQIVPSIGANGDSTGIVNKFYLSRHIDAHEILTIEENNNKLMLSITRLTKHLGDFSEAWKTVFIRKTQTIIESAINKAVSFSQVPR